MSFFETILWYAFIAWDYVLQMLPCAVLGAGGFFCLQPYRKKRLAVRGLRSGTGRETAIFLFVFFSAGLAALTLFPAYFWDSIVHGRAPSPFAFSIGSFFCKITVFYDLFHSGAWSFFMLLGNLVMFMPFGFFPALVGDKPRWWKGLLTGFCVSCLIEFVQLFIDRSSDINDILLNAFGALCGFWVYLLLDRFLPRLTAKFKCIKADDLHG